MCGFTGALNDFVQIGDVACDSESLAATAALEWFEDSERIRESLRNECHMPRSAGSTMENHNLGSCRPVPTNVDHEWMLILI